MTTAADPRRRHTHAPSPAPLVIRLRDLAPHLSHAARARLALDRIIDHSNRLDAAHDRATAYVDLLALRSSPNRVEDFTATVVTSGAPYIRQPVASTVYDTSGRLRRALGVGPRVVR